MKRKQKNILQPQMMQQSDDSMQENESKKRHYNEDTERRHEDIFYKENNMDTSDCKSGESKSSKASSRRSRREYDKRYREKMKKDPIKFRNKTSKYYRAYFEKLKQDPVRYSKYREEKLQRDKRRRDKIREIVTTDISDLSDDPIKRQEYLLLKAKYSNYVERNRKYQRERIAMIARSLKDPSFVIPKNKCKENNSRITDTSMSELTDDTHRKAGTKRKDATKTKSRKTSTYNCNYYGDNENDDSDDLSDNNEYVNQAKSDSLRESSDDSNAENILELRKRFENIVNATETEINEAPATTHMLDWPLRLSVNNNENNDIDNYENFRQLSNSPDNLFTQKGDVFERKKIKDTIGDFTVDTVQPVANLLKYFEENRLVYSTCKALTGFIGHQKTSRAHFFIPGLPLNTFPDDFDGSLPNRYFEKFQYKCTMPCITTRLNNLTSKDPLVQEIQTKSVWSQYVTSNVTAAIRGNYINQVQKMNDKVLYCPKELLRLSVLTEQDPDPLFDDNYNWFYAGNGNLHVISVNDSDCLLHSQLNKVYLSQFSRRKLKTKTDPLASFDCGDGNMILETLCNTNNFVTIRLRHKIYILQLKTQDNTLKFLKVKEVDSKIPFTSVEFDIYQKHILYITKLDGTLLIVNLELLKCRTLELMKGTPLVNNWNKIINIDPLSYCHVLKNALKIYDKRTNSVVQELTEFKNLSDVECDEITAARKCEDVPYVFLATNHLAFLIDVRCPSSQKPRLLRRWTHQMQCPPTYISQIKHEVDKELFCLSSQWPEDTLVISNDTNIYNRISLHTSMTIPYRLTSFETTLNEAKNKMQCVDIYHPIEQRLYTGLTGNCVMAANENVIALTLNSLGDIFAYTLYPEHLDKEDDSLDRLHEWSITMTKCTREKKIYSSSKIIDIAHVWKSLKIVPGDYVIGEGKLNKNKELHFDAKEVKDICESGKVDIALLDAWFDDEPEKDEQTALDIDLHFSDSE